MDWVTGKANGGGFGYGLALVLSVASIDGVGCIGLASSGNWVELQLRQTLEGGVIGPPEERFGKH